MATVEKQGGSLQLESLTALHWVGILAALVSVGVHLLLGVRRRVVDALGLPSTIVQIVLWYLVNFAGGGKSFPGGIGRLGAIDKPTQVVLLRTKR